MPLRKEQLRAVPSARLEFAKLSSGFSVAPDAAQLLQFVPIAQIEPSLFVGIATTFLLAAAVIARRFVFDDHKSDLLLATHV